MRSRDDTKRAFGLLTIGKNGTIGRRFTNGTNVYQHSQQIMQTKYSKSKSTNAKKSHGSIWRA